MRNWILAFSMVLGLPSAIAAAAAQDEAPKVRLVTSKGDIVIALRPDAAPQSVRNFLDYVEAGFYAGTIFHRVIDGFMIQGGGFAADYQRKPTRAPVPNEADNGLQNRRGSIAMARTFEPHSATAQFYINLQDNAFLDHRDKTPQGWGYAVFGQVVEGMDVVDAIGGVPTGPAGSFPKDAPREPIVIEKVERVGAADKDAAAAAKEE